MPAALAAEPLAYEAPHRKPTAPLHTERGTAVTGKRRKTAPGGKEVMYLPCRGTANYAFLVCLLEVRTAHGSSSWAPCHHPCYEGLSAGPQHRHLRLPVCLLEARRCVCCVVPCL